MAIAWDLEQLCQDSDGFEIADMIGMQKNMVGGHTFVECVNADHISETRINHAQLNRWGCYCHTCAKGQNNYNMVKYFHENVLHQYISHDEICRILVKSTMNPEETYILNKSKDSSEHRQKTAAFPLTNEECKLIGLATQPDYLANKQIIGCQEKKDSHLLKHGDEYLKVTPIKSPMSLRSLFYEDRDIFWELVKAKLSEAVTAQKLTLSLFASSGDDVSIIMARNARQTLVRLAELKSKVEEQ